MKFKKIFKWGGISLISFILGGFGALFMEYYLIPRLQDFRFLGQNDFLKNFSKKTTIINKTEQVLIKDEDSVNKIASQASASTVNILSIQNSTLKKSIETEKNHSEKIGGGAILTTDGIIVTYRGAIFEKNATYKVELFDGRIVDAVLKGVDEFSNLAYLAISVSNLSPLPFANPHDLFAGKKVIAIGKTQENYQNRYVAGILSEIDKTYNISPETIASSEKREGVLRIDLNNPDIFLGSPVIDYTGELVGVVGSLTRDGVTDFFLLPPDAIKESMDEILNQKESVISQEIGVRYLSLTPLLAQAYNLSEKQGAYVYASSGKQGLAVLSGSVAEKAGLKIYDIIVAVDGKPVDFNNPLSNLLNFKKDKREIELEIYRDGKKSILILKKKENNEQSKK